jgi:hypothetical protein
MDILPHKSMEVGMLFLHNSEFSVEPLNLGMQNGLDYRSHETRAQNLCQVLYTISGGRFHCCPMLKTKIIPDPLHYLGCKTQNSGTNYPQAAISFILLNMPFD